MDAPLIGEAEAMAQALADKGWSVTPPDGETWTQTFQPLFYEQGGDTEGEVYIRIDLPQGLYYGLMDAARAGLDDAQVRHARLAAIERKVKEEERTGVTRSSVGVLDGMPMTSLELRGALSFHSSTIDRYEKALDRADTRRHKR